MNIITIGGATKDIFIHTAPGSILREETADCAHILFEEGCKLEVNSLHYATGGGATNAAAVLKFLEHTVKPFCKLGDDQAGNFVLQGLQQCDISTELIITAAKGQTGTSFILPSPSGNRTILAYRGTNALLHKSEVPFKKLSACDGVYITSLSGESAKLLPLIAKYAQEHNITIATNPGKQQLKDGAQDLISALPYINMLHLNKKESETLYNQLGSDQPFSIEQYCKMMLEKGPSIVVVTCGAQGAYAASKPEKGEPKIYFQAADKVTNITNTVGAGDAFNATFFGMLMHGYNIEDALKFGTINSAALLQGQDAKDGLLALKELNKKSKN